MQIINFNKIIIGNVTAIVNNLKQMPRQKTKTIICFKGIKFLLNSTFPTFIWTAKTKNICTHSNNCFIKKTFVLFSFVVFCFVFVCKYKKSYTYAYKTK